MLRMCLPGYLQIEKSQILNLKQNDNDNIREKLVKFLPDIPLKGGLGTLPVSYSSSAMSQPA